mmetsp:Transcript_19625/g.42608  ORF Transcript_19625/g.42608 Transcript_19625/m.42608 type:complete len:777 (-) Transcript_19625:33-2363(-)
MGSSNQNSNALQDMMDIIDPSFEGADDIDDDDLLHALDSDVLMSFHGSNNNNPVDNGGNGGGIQNSHRPQVSGGAYNRMGSHNSNSNSNNNSMRSNHSCSLEPFMLDSDYCQNMMLMSADNKNNSNNNSRDGGSQSFNNDNNMSSNRSCSSEPFMLDTDIYQNMMMSAADTSNNNYNNRNGGNNGGGMGSMIGTTVKAPLAPLASESRGRTKRAPRRKARSRSNSCQVDADMIFDQQQPLFGGDRSDENFGMDMFSNSSDDLASACSAPADLFEVGGFHNNGNNGGMGGGNNNYNPASIPDILDIQKLLAMSGGHANTGRNNNMNEFQPQQIQRPQMQAGPRRRNTVDGVLAWSLDSTGSSNSNGTSKMTSCEADQNNGTYDGRPRRRRKTLDDPLSFMANMMSAMGGNTEPLPMTEQLQMGFNDTGDLFGNDQQKAPLKRRKSEPFMSSFWDDTADDCDGGDMAMHNNMGQESNDNVRMPLNNMGAPHQNQQQVQQANATQIMMSKTFITAAQEAFASINRLKELINGAGGSPQVAQFNRSQSVGADGMEGSDMGGQRKQRQQQGQWQQHQQQQGRQQQQRHGPQGPQVQGSHEQDRVIPTNFQSSPSNNQFRRSGSQGSTSSAPADIMFTNNQRATSPAPKVVTSVTKRKKGSSSKSKGGKASSSKSTSSVPVTAAVAPEIPLPSTADPELLKLDQEEVLAKLQSAMDRTKDTQKLLQEWDRANGLPKSHSQTMVNSSRSRKQLTDGIILKKWNGTPLLNFAKEGAEGTASRLF